MFIVLSGLSTLNFERKVYMQNSNDSSPQQDSDTPMALYFFVGGMGIFAIFLVLYIFFGA
jgi:hypothetical protein